MVTQGSPYIEKLMTLLRLKGKTEVLKSIVRFKKHPCLIIIYFHLISELNTHREYQLWMEPDWCIKDLYDKCYAISRGWINWINDAGIKEINDLQPEEIESVELTT